MEPKRSELHFHLVDDDPDFRSMIAVLLTGGGHRTSESDSATQVVERARKEPPDCVLIDLMMPGSDGLELCRRLRALPELERTKLVILTAKSYGFDRSSASRQGADAYLVKPIDRRSLVATLERIVRDELRVTFWGVRGTLPVPGPGSLRYGGNTPCVTVDFPNGRLFVFDAGTGIKVFSDSLADRRSGKLDLSILVSHPHWDHINALPFFGPLYEPGNRIDVYGPASAGTAFEKIVLAQMDSVYFPVTSRQFAAELRCHDLAAGRYQIDGVEVETLFLSHPGNCLGYRVNCGEKSVCYATDNEIYPKRSTRYNARFNKLLRAFWQDVSLLVTDSTYGEQEYGEHRGWGHSSVVEVTRLAHEAGVAHLCLFHHDPDQDDDDIDEKLAAARAHLAELGSKTRCSAPAERESIVI